MHCLQRSDKDIALELLRYTTSNGRKPAARTASTSSIPAPHPGDVIENHTIAHRSKTRLVRHRVRVLPSLSIKHRGTRSLTYRQGILRSI